LTEEKLFREVEALEGEMVECLKNCIKIKAIGPKNGGEGEAEKAKYLEDLIKDFGFDEISRIDVPDGSVPAGYRPNIIAKIKGTEEKTLWVISHMDVVPEGDVSKWDTPPFEPVVKDGRIYGRGAEDNGQDLVASIFAAKAIKKAGLTPRYTYAVMLSADEETGSEKGVKYILEHHRDLFKEGDLIMVPDAPSPDGNLIEVSEKSILWLKVKIVGKQCHGSMPQSGVNAHKAGAKFITAMDEAIYSKFDMRDELFTPPISTFEPTKKEANVPNINTIPGEDIIYFDNRILPDVDVDAVLDLYKEVAAKIEAETSAKFEFTPVMLDRAAPPTPPDSEIVRLTERWVKAVYNNNPKPGGIGGGTYAAMFRRQGFHAVVWARGDELAHGYNEYSKIENLVGDAKVFAGMAVFGL